MELAGSFGASVETVAGKDVLGAIMEYARDRAVTDLFIGYSGPSNKTYFRHLPAYRLVHSLPDVDVHIIPDASVQLRPSRLETREKHRLNGRDFIRMGSVMAAATFISYLFDKSPFSNSNIITIYILAVLITSMITAERIYGIIAAILYILLFNFLFIEPRFTFAVYDLNYLVTYLVSIIAAVITGNISSKMKQFTLQARASAYQTQILLNASELFQRSGSADEITQTAVGQLRDLLGREIQFIPAEDPSGTERYPEGKYQHLAVRTGSRVYGTMAVAADRGDMNGFEENILLSLISECALALENDRNRKEREEAQIIAENERFRSKLLRSISHDLRTPLTSISGNASNLLDHARNLDDEEKKRIYRDISSDAIWLIDLVENLLAITRIENNLEIHPTGEVVADVLSAAVSNVNRHQSGHTIILNADNDCLVAWMDVPLILQVVINLLNNAVKHTPPSTNVTISDYREGDKVIISIADDGPGISEEDKPHIFDLFYTGSRAEADSSRSLGLGLNLCRSILASHGQEIRVEDVHPHGAAFLFSLDLWKGNENEVISDIDC